MPDFEVGVRVSMVDWELVEEVDTAEQAELFIRKYWENQGYEVESITVRPYEPSAEGSAE